MHWIAGPLCLSLESGQHPDVWMTFPRRLDLPVVPEDSESTGGSHGVPWPMPCLSAILGLSGEREPSAASQGWAKDFRDIPDLPWLPSGYCTRSNMLQAIASNTQTWWGVLSFTAWNQWWRPFRAAIFRLVGYSRQWLLSTASWAPTTVDITWYNMI